MHRCREVRGERRERILTGLGVGKTVFIEMTGKLLVRFAIQFVRWPGLDTASMGLLGVMKELAHLFLTSLTAVVRFALRRALS